MLNRVTKRKFYSANEPLRAFFTIIRFFIHLVICLLYKVARIFCEILLAERSFGHFTIFFVLFCKLQKKEREFQLYEKSYRSWSYLNNFPSGWLIILLYFLKQILEYSRFIVKLENLDSLVKRVWKIINKDQLWMHIAHR